MFGPSWIHIIHLLKWSNWEFEVVKSQKIVFWQLWITTLPVKRPSSINLLDITFHQVFSQSRSCSTANWQIAIPTMFFRRMTWNVGQKQWTARRIKLKAPWMSPFLVKLRLWKHGQRIRKWWLIWIGWRSIEIRSWNFVGRSSNVKGGKTDLSEEEFVTSSNVQLMTSKVEKKWTTTTKKDAIAQKAEDTFRIQCRQRSTENSRM